MAEIAAGYDPFATSGSWRRSRAKVVVYAVLTLFAAYYLLPLWVVIANAFRDLPEISRNGIIGFPHTFNAGAWQAAWSTYCVGGPQVTPHIVARATSEGLSAHADSVRIRVDPGPS